jgi:hypothetical protein
VFNNWVLLASEEAIEGIASGGDNKIPEPCQNLSEAAGWEVKLR